MEEAFRALLLGSASVTALVGQRVGWGSHPQGQPYPAVVLHVISDAEGHVLTGSPTGLSLGRVQVDCYAATYAAAKGLARAVRALLDGHRGGSFDGILLAGTRDGREDAGPEPLFRVSLDFLTYYRRA